MGNITLGCLLGQYDRAQSFDVESHDLTGASNINSWALHPANVGSYKFTATDVHSSGQGLLVTINSAATFTQYLTTYYSRADDAFARWSPDVTTHVVQCDLWQRMKWSADSGKLTSVLNGLGAHGIVVARHSSLTHYRHQIFATSLSGPWLRIIATGPVTGQHDYVLDDVLTQADPITLHPEYSLSLGAQLEQSSLRTRNGNLHTTVWHRHFAATLPLRWLSNSHANLINWWWQHQHNLLLRLDEDDPEQVVICRIVNNRQPIGAKRAPYALNDGGWEGVLELESIHQGGLVF